MGVIADIITNAKSFSTTPGSPRHQVYDRLKYLVNNGLDFDYPANCDVANQVQSIAQHVHATGGTYTLTFTLFSGETFTTGNLAYNAITSAVTTAINSAATSATIAGWTDGDIVVGGSALSAGAMTFTFSGASVAGLNHSPITASTALTTYNAAQGQAGAVSTTTAGTGGTDAVQKIVKYLTTVADGALHVTGGTFTLTFNPNGGTPFTTAAIAWNAAHAVVQTAINTANGTLGDDTIVVGGNGLDTADMTFTFSGSGVTHLSQPLIVVDSTSLTATVVGTAGAITKSTVGQSKRSGWAALNGFSIISDAPPAQGVAATSVTVVNDSRDFPHGIDNETVKALIDEIAIHDVDPGSKTVLLRALGL